MSHKYCKCPMCFINWEEGMQNDDIEPIYCETKCDFCEKNPNSLQLLLRQIEIMPKAHLTDFPKVFKHLIDHVELKP